MTRGHDSRLMKLGHPTLATLLTVGLASLTPAEAASPEPVAAAAGAELAQTLELIKEEETVSIASRYEQPISQSPSNVYVITDDDIRQSGATDLPTVLRRIPGIEVMQTTGADFNVSVRGDNQLVANKLLVMVDGRSIYVDTQGQVYWKAIPVTLPEIKRIEVLKGPASVLYGFNAFDGIVNIITKSASEMKGTTLQFGGGELGTISSAAIYGGTIGKLGYRLSIGRDQTNQWRNRDALAFRSHKFNVQAEYELSNDSKFLFSGGLVDVNRLDGPVTVGTISMDRPALGYAHMVYERSDLVVRAFWNSFNDTSDPTPHPVFSNLLRFTDLMGNVPSVFRGNTYNVEAQHAIALSTSNRMTYGINYRLNTLSSNYIAAYTTENRLGLYVQDEWKPFQTLTLIAGARYDLNTFINPTLSPRASILYTPIPDHTFRATVAVGYRPPTIFETRESNLAVTTFPPPLPSPPPILVQGSQNLSPEEIVSYEVSYQGWFMKHRLRAHAALFYNHISDLITFGGLGPVQAGGVADIYGGEAGIEFLATKSLSGYANYSYQEMGQSLTGTAQRAGPRSKWNVGLRGDWDNGVTGEIAYHYYGAVTYPLPSVLSSFAAFGVIPPNPRVGSYNLLNLRAGYKFWQQKAAAGYLRDAEVAVSAFNALNDRHKEHPLGDTIGSRVMGWLTVRF